MQSDTPAAPPPRPVAYVPITELYVWTTVIRDPRRGVREVMPIVNTADGPGPGAAIGLTANTLAEALKLRDTAQAVANQSGGQVWLRKFMQAATLDARGTIIGEAPIETLTPKRVVTASQVPSILQAAGGPRQR